MMDLFYDSLPGKNKQRIHFHRFMARIHEALRAMPAVRDPLKKIARQWSEQYRVLCFDEFFVADIADAMLLGGLLQALFEEGVTLIATSNVHPDQLYQHGLQRAKFLPAIKALKNHTSSIQVDGEQDFRLRLLRRAETYLQPLGEVAEAALGKAYARMSGGVVLDNNIMIHGRCLTARQRSAGIIWFDFNSLCEQPRNTADYMEIAHSFHTVLVSAVPELNEHNADATRRFINLIDEFYDRNVKILMSAAQPIEQLYTGKRLDFEFQRTTSRLTEMQTHLYLAKPHLP